MKNITNKILLAAKYGSQDAINKIVERYCGMVHSIAVRYSLSRPWAKECTQDILNYIIEHIWDFGGDAKELSVWVFAMTKKYLRNLYQRKSPNIVKFSTLYVSYKMRDVSLLEGIIGFECYYILIFRFVYNLPFENIARIMDIPIEKVKDIYEKNYKKAMNIIKRIKRK